MAPHPPPGVGVAASEDLSGKRASVDAADLEKLKKILKPLECEGTMATHACSGVGYPRRRWTRELTERLLSELLAIVEGATTTAEEKREAARVAVLGATEWAFFRPHTDGHWRIRERVTVAAAVRTAAPRMRSSMRRREG